MRFKVKYLSTSEYITLYAPIYLPPRINSGLHPVSKGADINAPTIEAIDYYRLPQISNHN